MFDPRVGTIVSAAFPLGAFMAGVGAENATGLLLKLGSTADAGLNVHHERVAELVLLSVEGAGNLLKTLRSVARSFGWRASVTGDFALWGSKGDDLLA